MMRYPHDIEEKLGFDKVRGMLRGRCAGELGRQLVDKLKFSTNDALIRKLCGQTEEYMKMVQNAEPLPALSYPDIENELKKLPLQGGFLEAHEIYAILKTLKTLHEWEAFLRKRKDAYPVVAALAQNILIDEALINAIERCIDEKGQLRENASSALRKIRVEMQKSEVRARKKLEQVLREARNVGMSPEDSSLTVRGGRLVIPLRAEYKRSVKGFIHDASASGNILFVEPEEVLEINNAIKELSYEEKREIIRILTALTDDIREHHEAIAAGRRFLGIIDLIRAKALFSHEFEAIVPQPARQGAFEWQGAVNPVLKKALDKQGKPLVPLDIRMNGRNRILVISGPNAGGKSVCLQTVGLLQYMYQCGMPVPVKEGSTMMIFHDIFIDIGDEQSIENDLSTYSSHLRAMNLLLKIATKNTFFLIDEFGSGTDPQFGGAIAEAILEELISTKARGIITTHYNNLKKLAESHEGLVNARMRFDVNKLEPLYRLEIGRPGSSFALEIAGKIGLPGKILREARKKAGADAVTLDRLLNDLEREKKYYEEESRKYAAQNETLEKTIANYNDLKEDLDERKKELLNEAKTEAQMLLRQANQRVENLIRQIRETEAEKEATKKLRRELKEFEEKIKPRKLKRRKKGQESEVKVVGGDLLPGSHVRLRGQETIGEVLKVGKRDAEVRFGELKSKIRLDRLERVSGGVMKKENKKRTAPISGIDINARKAQFSHNLDVRGKRAYAALKALENFLDDALLFGTPEVRIIHGKGDGILREVLRNALKDYKEVKSFHDEHADRGGAGTTVVELG